MLENFGFFWHIGMEWNYVCLKETLDGYDYNFLAQKLLSPPPNNYADFIWALFSTHRLWTQPYITGEDPLCQPRKDEKQRSFKQNTNYIQKYLDKYFYYQSGKINIDFCFEFTTKETCLPNGKEIDYIDYTSENILALTQSNIKKIFSSIFLCFADSCNENDFLPYINLYIYFNFFKYIFKYVEINEALSLTSYETFINNISTSIEFNHKENDYLLHNLYDRIIKLKNSKDFTRLMSSSFDIDDNIDYFSIYNSIIVENNLDIFTDLLQRLIADHTALNYTEIYNNKIKSIFLEIKKHALVSDEDIKKEIYKVYLSLIGSDI